ncbi:MAG: hypothetical protein KIT69_19095, partial [Propionibacteriaceae bacterium]|nr:hypothetical protein [Propionibacteriaceae bacterium]
GTNYGVVFGGYALAGLVAPQVAAAIGIAGDYAPVFGLVIGSAAIGLALLAALARLPFVSSRTSEPR